jgi:Thioredoxin
MAEQGWEASGLPVLRTSHFSGDHLNLPGIFVVSFAAAWCPITRRFMPKFAARKGRLAATVAIADITDLKDPLWDTFRIRITPTIIVFRDGRVSERVDGRRLMGITDSQLRKLDQALSAGPPGIS